ncbi:MAG TPA: DUF4184 family protein [Microthrixaceae bacterium]|nr:DUF4184 family protein [Microthrixaceae bacterium]
MPVTFPAHQAVVLPIKLKWPQRSDATAMCIGAAAPDFGYAIIGRDSHSLLGVIMFAIPVTLLASWVLRRGAASPIFGNAPDCGPFRIHSYRVLAERRPGSFATFAGASIGAFSHVLLDSFTHAERWGSQLVGLDGIVATVPWRGDISAARVLQYFGHSLGTAISLLLFLYIGRHRLLERFYGSDKVNMARSLQLTTRARMTFWATTFCTSTAVAAALVATGGSPVFSSITGVFVGALVAGSLPSTHAMGSPNGPLVECAGGRHP